MSAWVGRRLRGGWREPMLLRHPSLSPEIDVAIAAARAPSTKRIRVSDRVVEVQPRSRPDPTGATIRSTRSSSTVSTTPRRRLTSPGTVHMARFQGGTFEGIRRRLDYLRHLGVGALWLCRSSRTACRSASATMATGSRISSRSSRVSPAGRRQTSCEPSSTRLHARNLYVIFDVVLNHADDVSPTSATAIRGARTRVGLRPPGAALPMPSVGAMRPARAGPTGQSPRPIRRPMAAIWPTRTPA